MSFIANHCVDLMFVCFIFVYVFKLWYNYMAKINKFSDEELFERYVYASRKGKIK